MSFIFRPQGQPAVAILHSERSFPVRRIFCVGQNYADHAREMGSDPNRESPFFFSKPADAVVANGEAINYPGQTQNLHHEVELVVALDRAALNIDTSEASECIYGYAVGNDLTRRDLQSSAKKIGRPWDVAKGFDQSAPLSALVPITECGELISGEISLKVNGETRQAGDLSQMIWNVNEIITTLSRLYHLQPGDLIFTGTPAGVGSVKPGDVLEAYIEGVGSLSNSIIEPLIK